MKGEYTNNDDASLDHNNSNTLPTSLPTPTAASSYYHSQHPAPTTPIPPPSHPSSNSSYDRQSLYHPYLSSRRHSVSTGGVGLSATYQNYAQNLGYHPYPNLASLQHQHHTNAAAAAAAAVAARQTPFVPRPKLTTTLWEDEGTICYQVDANGICVARRHDNDMINGTKLLNVAGMSRGKRDGILKNEKGRVVVKVGAMHLKGVWITYARAKALANQYKILDTLHPLFVDNPSGYLYASPLHH
ncbi:transcription regulator HTH, apses-type DNA-binding domain-containing protein, partial [Syncephalastrum racemosum]